MGSDLKKAILYSLFPPDAACLSCGREAVVLDDGLCADCHAGAELFNAAPPLPNVDGFTSVYVYNEVSGRMVRKLKYNGARYLAHRLADRIELPKDWDPDAAVPVPLYYRKQWKRGYNQSELIARSLCRRLGIPLETELLLKVRDTEPQAGLSEAGRKRNLRRAFAADPKVKGMRILLVDDVRTTGSTLSECAAELKRCGASTVWAAAVCTVRPDASGDRMI